MKVAYFKEQGLEVFLDKLRVQGWLELFTNTQLGCSVPNLAKFHTHCSVTDRVVTNEVNGMKLRFDAKEMGEILGIFLPQGLICMSAKTSLYLAMIGYWNLPRSSVYNQGRKHLNPSKRGI